MKKILALLVAAVMLLSLVPMALADDAVEIEFQFHKGETDAINAMTAAIDAFNAANPGIHVEMNTAGDTNSMVARSQQDDLPDIFACQTSATFEKMFAAGQLMDLTGQDFLNNIVEGTLALSTYEGKNWRLPYSLSCYGLYIRTDIFEEQGLAWPTTWAELMDVCEKLKAAGIWGFANPDKDMVYQRMERMMSMLADNDDEFKAIAAGEMEAKDSKVLSTYAQASLDIAQYTNPLSAGAGYDESYQMFLKGDAAMTINGQWSLGTLLGFNPDLKVAMIPLPDPTGAESNVIVSIDTSFVVSSKTKYPEECLKFLAYLAQTDVAQAYTDVEGSPNVVKGVVYSVKELEKINDAMAAGHTMLSLNAIWPSGLRKALGLAATDLIVEKNLDAFYDQAQLDIEDYYN